MSSSCAYLQNHAFPEALNWDSVASQDVFASFDQPGSFHMKKEDLLKPSVWLTRALDALSYGLSEEDNEDLSEDRQPESSNRAHKASQYSNPTTRQSCKQVFDSMDSIHSEKHNENNSWPVDGRNFSACNEVIRSTRSKEFRLQAVSGTSWHNSFTSNVVPVMDRHNASASNAGVVPSISNSSLEAVSSFKPSKHHHMLLQDHHTLVSMLSQIETHTLVLGFSYLFWEALEADVHECRSATIFDASVALNCTLDTFLLDFVQRQVCSPECIPLAYVLINKVRNSVCGLFLNDLNIHRLITLALTLSSKLIDDRYCANEWFALAAQTDLRKFNALEVHLSFMLGFNFNVFVGEYIDAVHQAMFLVRSAFMPQQHTVHPDAISWPQQERCDLPPPLDSSSCYPLNVEHIHHPSYVRHVYPACTAWETAPRHMYPLQMLPGSYHVDTSFVGQNYGPIPSDIYSSTYYEPGHSFLSHQPPIPTHHHAGGCTDTSISGLRSEYFFESGYSVRKPQYPESLAPPLPDLSTFLNDAHMVYNSNADPPPPDAAFAEMDIYGLPKMAKSSPEYIGWSLSKMNGTLNPITSEERTVSEGHFLRKCKESEVYLDPRHPNYIDITVPPEDGSANHYNHLQPICNTKCHQGVFFGARLSSKESDNPYPSPALTGNRNGDYLTHMKDIGRFPSASIGSNNYIYHMEHAHPILQHSHCLSGKSQP
eukprot:gene9255-1534_t